LSATHGGGDVCSVEFLVALDLIDAEAVATALLRAIERRARHRGAVALRLDLPYGTATSRELLRRLDKCGHRVERIGLLKSLRSAGRVGPALRKHGHAG
jgi:hypothetical protein